MLLNKQTSLYFFIIFFMILPSLFKPCKPLNFNELTLLLNWVMGTFTQR
jgi:hypothetical protein